MKEEKSGSISEVIFHNEENLYSIIIVENDTEQFCAVGNMPHPKPGRSYTLLGEWKVHPKYGEQFAFSSFEEKMPTTEDGIISFLSSGVIRGIGPSTAAAIVKKFGEDSLNVIEQHPERLTSVNGIGSVKAAAIAAGLAEHREYADTVLELSAFDISSATCLRLYKKYGREAAAIIRENPYRLMDDVDGIGFIRADKIASKIGFDEESPFRISCGLVYALNYRSMEGDTFTPKNQLIEDTAAFLNVSRESCEECLFTLAVEGKVCFDTIDDVQIVQLRKYFDAEKSAAVRLYALCNATLESLSDGSDEIISRCEQVSGIKLSPQQTAAVKTALKNGVSIITGGPGTGKTTIINSILYVLKTYGVSFALAAPTGRAAKRMSQATGEDASTIHRLLEYYFSESDDVMRFGRNEDNPLDYDCIIIDEMSMVDILLMDGLLSAIKAGTRLILVGDADQLPPVGAGSVLKDMLACENINSVRLTDIFRQAAESMIVVNAHLINKGEHPSFNEKDKDFFFIDRKRDSQIAETISDLCVRRLPSFFTELDPVKDIQVLTPARKGLLGSIELNKQLQAVLNPPAKEKSEKTFGNRIFRTGDKVIQTKNNYMIEWEDVSDFSTHQGVFNGDIGIVHRVNAEASLVSVIFDSERLVVYDYSSIEELELAYALTVHKSQGSEFPVVVMPMTRFAPMLSTRNLLYTAVTRAKSAAVLVGNLDACNAMVDNNQDSHRNSGLKFRLTGIWEFDV